MRRKTNILFKSMNLAVLLPALLFLYSFLPGNVNQEYAVKAMFIYNFTKYIDWPNNSNSNEFIISVYGDSEITPFLREIAMKKNVNGKQIIIRSVHSLVDAVGSQILFMPEIAKINLSTLSPNQKSKLGLIISEGIGSLNMGVHISLVNVNDKIRFELNEIALKNDEIKYSKELVILSDKLY